MSATIRVKSPADLLAAIPLLVGSVPKQSVVLLVLRGELPKAVLRFDLPGTAAPAILKRVVTHVIGMICKVEEIESIVITIHTDEPIASGLPHPELIDILLRRLRQTGFRIHDALCQAQNGWGSYLEAELPDGGHPLTELEEAASGRLEPADNHPPESLIPKATKESKDRTNRELANYRALVDALHETDDDPPELEALCDLPRFVEDALTWSGAERETKGALLLFAVQGPPVRDATMLQWAFGFELGDVLYDEAERFARDGLDLEDERSNLLGNLMMGIGPRPDSARVKQGIELLRTLVAWATPPDRLAPLCMLAWLTWALGKGTLAGQLINEARSIDAEYGMAELLDQMLSNGHLPDWVFIEPERT